ncbi:MAG TPA: hypothetical protein VGV60_07900 [Candidatus Polarisedimenticolia bacterium]|nr:hypothetical protein [Candidatus Polarisedimenticolia bacterium]
MGRLLGTLLILLPTALVAAGDPPAPPPATKTGAGEGPAAAPGADETLTVELHSGIPGMAFIGQSLDDLLKKFPGADVTAFAGQDDAVTVKVPAVGISCIAVGAPDSLKVASVGFNLEGAYEGMSEGHFRTGKGIGKGSTVNDLLEAYGPPIDLMSARPRGVAPRADANVDPSVPRKYQYVNESGSVRTYFSVENYRVTRIVVNELAPLERHLLKGRPKN